MSIPALCLLNAEDSASTSGYAISCSSETIDFGCLHREKMEVLLGGCIFVGPFF
jgi:hypothetical protein